MIDASSPERTLADRRMREVNEAWTVLQDPARRRRYDDGRIQGRPSSGGSGAGAQRVGRPSTSSPVPVDDDDLVDVLPEMGPVAASLFRHVPWVVLVVVFGLIFVVTAYASSDRTPAVPQHAQPGSCVNVRTGPTTTIVPCSGPHELRIVARVDDATTCPAGTEKRRLGSDGLFDCVRPD